jgi:hypothetical protein
MEPAALIDAGFGVCGGVKTSDTQFPILFYFSIVRELVAKICLILSVTPSSNKIRSDLSIDTICHSSSI